MRYDRIPEYAPRFQCIAGACPHSCCTRWEVEIDGETAARYREIPGALGERLRAALSEDEEGNLCFPLTEEGHCPFLDAHGLCEIHDGIGQEFTSMTCRSHPRFWEDYGPFRELTLSAACPVANALLLESEAPLTFSDVPADEEPEDGDPWLPALRPFRDRLLTVLQNRALPLSVRLGQFLTLSAAAQELLDDDRADLLETLPAPEANVRAVLPSGSLALLSSLEALEADWPEVLAAAQRNTVIAACSDALSERIAAYFAFRYPMKCVNDGDLLSRAEFCVFAVLVIEKLAAVCGLAEALRRFCCEIEHDADHLDAILDAFLCDGAFAPERFLAEA